MDPVSVGLANLYGVSNSTVKDFSSQHSVHGPAQQHSTYPHDSRAFNGSNVAKRRCGFSLRGARNGEGQGHVRGENRRPEAIPVAGV
jgi:hypothetical protein